MWCIFYRDGTCFGSKDGEPKDAPCKGVLVIMQDTRHCKVKGDWYTWDFAGKEWFGRTDFGLSDYIRENKVQIIRQGVPIKSELFKSLIRRVATDNTFRFRSKSEPWLNRKGEIA